MDSETVQPGSLYVNMSVFVDLFQNGVLQRCYNPIKMCKT